MHRKIKFHLRGGRGGDYTGEQASTPAAKLATKCGISKLRLYSIAEGLDTEGHKIKARIVRYTADYIDQLMQLPGAEEAFFPVLDKLVQENDAANDKPPQRN